MAATDLTRPRWAASSTRVLPIVLSLLAIGWISYVSGRAAWDSYDLAEKLGFVQGLHVQHWLGAAVGGPVIASAFAMAAAFAGNRVLALTRGLIILAAIVGAAVLSVTSGQVPEALTFAGLALWCWCVGGPLLRLLDRAQPVLYGWPRLALETALGLALLSFLVLAIALPGLLSGLSLVLILGAGLIASLAARIFTRAPVYLADPYLGEGGHSGFVECVGLAVLAAGLLTHFGVSLSPQTSFDALHYHFAMPRIFLDEGGFVERPDIIQGYFPLGLEMVFVPAYHFGGESTMNLLHWLFAGLSAAVLWGTGDRLFGKPAGVLAAGAWALSPLVLWESSSGYNDLAMAFWLLAAGSAMVAFLSRPTNGGALAVGLFAGLALTFKIVSGIYVLAVVVAFLAAALMAMPRDLRTRARQLVLFGLGGVVTGAPWLLIRFVQTGNPVFPLYNNIFRSDKWPERHEKFDLWLFGIGKDVGNLDNVFWDLSLTPDRFGQWMYPWGIGVGILASLLVVPMLPRLVQHRGVLVLLLYALVAALCWFFLSQYHRYGLPAFGLLTLAGAGALWLSLKDLPAVAGQAIAGTLLFLWLGIGVGSSMFVFNLDGFPVNVVVLGKESRDEYRDRRVPGVDALTFLDERTRGTDDEIGVIGSPYNFYVINPAYDLWVVEKELSAFRGILEAMLPADATARALYGANVRWILVDYNQLHESQVGFLNQTILAPEFFNRYMQVAFEKNRVVVYRILEPGGR